LDMESTRKESLKPWHWGSGLFKPKRKAMKLRGDDFREAQQDPRVKGFHEKAEEQDEKLHREGLIHP
jgi:hypothetical protein